MDELAFVIIGDSNVDRNFPKLQTSESEDPLVQSTVMVRATNLVQIHDALLSITDQKQSIILAGLTNPLTSHLFEIRLPCVTTAVRSSPKSGSGSWREGRLTLDV